MEKKKMIKMFHYFTKSLFDRFLAHVVIYFVLSFIIAFFIEKFTELLEPHTSISVRMFLGALFLFFFVPCLYHCLGAEKQCKNCKQIVYDNEIECPKCKYEQQDALKRWVPFCRCQILYFVALIIAAICLLVGCEIPLNFWVLIPLFSLVPFFWVLLTSCSSFSLDLEEKNQANELVKVKAVVRCQTQNESTSVLKHLLKIVFTQVILYKFPKECLADSFVENDKYFPVITALIHEEILSATKGFCEFSFLEIYITELSISPIK